MEDTDDRVRAASAHGSSEHESSVRESDIRVGGQVFRVTQAGSGRPLLLINGIGATRELFQPLRIQLADRETITFDPPGIGGSPAPLWPPTMRQLAMLVDGLVHRLGHEQVDILGLSWGGMLAQELAHRHPHTVRRLVLAGTLPGWTSVPGNPVSLAVLTCPLRFYSARFFQLVSPLLYGQHLDAETVAEHARLRTSRPPSLLGFHHQLAALRRWTSLPWLHRLDVPTLVISGDDDLIVPHANARLLSHLIPGARLHTVNQGGHLFVYTHPEQTATAVRRFLDRPEEPAADR